MPGGVHNIKCSADDTGDDSFSPMPHQEDAIQAFRNSSHKGMVFALQLGYGKTGAAILLAEEMLDDNEINHVYVLTPGSLRKNFVNEYCKKVAKDPSRLKSKYTFITYNTNVGKHLPKSFSKSLVIVDEAHNLINSVCNASKNAVTIYKKLYRADCRILLLTGTPIYNRVAEVPVLIDLLKPGTFPEYWEETRGVDREKFLNLFKQEENGKLVPHEKDELLKKLGGVIYYIKPKKSSDYPELLEEKKIEVDMPQYQEDAYIRQFMLEKRLMHISEAALHRNPTLRPLKIMALKHVLSRPPSNFAHPPSVLKKEGVDGIEVPSKVKQSPANKRVGKKDEEEAANSDGVDAQPPILKVTDKSEKDGGWFHRRYFKHGELVKQYSPKLYEMLKNIGENLGQKHFVFSWFKTQSGVDLIASFLRSCGLSVLVYSGDVGSDKKRQDILDKFNSKDNLYGEKYQVILATASGAEGITLLNVRHVHIFESDKREYLIKQVIGRARRFRSHNDLPLAERTVQVWRYFSKLANRERSTAKVTYDDAGTATTKKTELPSEMKAIDEILYEKGQYKLTEIESVLKLLYATSVAKI